MKRGKPSTYIVRGRQVTSGCHAGQLYLFVQHKIIEKGNLEFSHFLKSFVIKIIIKPLLSFFSLSLSHIDYFLISIKNYIFCINNVKMNYIVKLINRH